MKRDQSLRMDKHDFYRLKRPDTTEGLGVGANGRKTVGRIETT